MFNVRMLLVSILLFVFCSPLSSYAESDEAAMMANAKSHYQNGGYYFATTWLERILKNWPNTPQREEVLLMLAKGYAATERDERALRTVKTLLKDFPKSADKLDPSLLKFVEIEARKAGAPSPAKPVVLPASSPTAKAVAEPATVPAAPAATEAVKLDVQPPLVAPVVASAPAAIKASVEAATPVKIEGAAPPVAPVTNPAPATLAAAEPAKTALASPAVPTSKEAPGAAASAAPPVVPVTNPAPATLAAAEPAKTALASPAVPTSKEAPGAAATPAKVEVAAPPVAPVAEPAPAKVDASEPPKPAPAPAEPAAQETPVEARTPAKIEAAAPQEAQPKPAPAKSETAETTKLPTAPEEPVAPRTPVEGNAPAKVDTAAPLEALVSKPAPAAVGTVGSKEAPEARKATVAFPEGCKAGSYTLVLGGYVGRNRLVSAKKMVGKAGLVPVVEPGPKKAAMMFRIQVGEFADMGAADQLVKKLRRMSADHFALKDKAGTHRVFAGSYYDKDAAAREQQRLASLGVNSVLRQVNVPVPTFMLSAGCFRTEEAAQGKMAELEKLGMKGTVLLSQ